jgi:hypothetical protein
MWAKKIGIGTGENIPLPAIVQIALGVVPMEMRGGGRGKTRNVVPKKNRRGRKGSNSGKTIMKYWM